MDERESKLPKWAQEAFADMRKRIQYSNEPLLKEVVELRPKVALLKAKNEAMLELLECAAKGGHTTAAEIIKIIEGYDLTLTPR